MGAVFTTAGATLMATQFAAEMALVIDSVQVGTLTSGQRYDATVGATALVDATPTKTFTSNIDLLSSGANVEIVLLDSSTDAYNASEVGFFSGTTLVFLWANQADDIYVKAAGASSLATITAAISGATVTSIQISVPTIVPATQAQAAAGVDALAYMTPERTRGEMDGTQRFPESTSFRVDINTLRNQGVYLVRVSGNTDNRPTGVSGDAKLEVTQFWRTSAGTLTIGQELSVASTGAIYSRTGVITATPGNRPTDTSSSTVVWAGWNRTGLPVASNAQIDVNDVDTASNDTAITPKGLLRKLAAFVRNATTTATGMVALATNAEATAGSNDTKAMTPAASKAAIDARLDGKITISNSAPQSSDGANNDIWLEY